MFVIMGASGHVGRAVIDVLLEQGQEVIAVTHDPKHVDLLQRPGVHPALADVTHPDSLRQVFKQGRRAFLLNPPASVEGDTDAVERRTAACILEALRETRLEKVVLASTGGARPGERLGDLNVLWELEEGVRALPIPAAINRGGYYMSNWDGQLDEVRRSGTLVSFFPEDLRVPMVAPRDLGEAAARRLLSGPDDTGVANVEGPVRYAASDVAAAFGRALRREVALSVVPRVQWASTFRSLGFSDAAADAYARMTEVTVDSLDLPDDPVRGKVTIDAYLQELVGRR